MSVNYEMADILANLACSRARLQHGLATASACGDYKWCSNTKPSILMLDNKINSLLKVLSPETVAEARDITNAPI